jgi:hypothetical protein
MELEDFLLFDFILFFKLILCIDEMLNKLVQINFAVVILITFTK